MDRKDYFKSDKEIAAEKARAKAAYLKRKHDERVGTIVMIIFAIVFTLICCEVGEKTFENLNYYEMIKTDMMSRCLDTDYFSDTYHVGEGRNFKIEILPYGMTDDIRYNPNGIRLVKTTWYHDDTKKQIDSIQYGVFIYPEETE